MIQELNNQIDKNYTLSSSLHEGKNISFNTKLSESFSEKDIIMAIENYRIQVHISTYSIFLVVIFF